MFLTRIKADWRRGAGSHPDSHRGRPVSHNDRPPTGPRLRPQARTRIELGRDGSDVHGVGAHCRCRPAIADHRQSPSAGERPRSRTRPITVAKDAEVYLDDGRLGAFDRPPRGSSPTWAAGGHRDFAAVRRPQKRSKRSWPKGRPCRGS